MNLFVGGQMLSAVLLFCLFSCGSVQNDKLVSSVKKKKDVLKNTEEFFKAAFYEARLQQLDVVQSILKFQDYEKQYKIIYKAVEKCFEVMEKSKVIVESSDYIPGVNFPTNGSVTEALGQILDSVTLYGELQLKLPDITDRIMNNHPDWLAQAKWAIGFSNSTGLFDEKTTLMINLLCQEMNLIERNGSFYNPYRKYVKVPQDKGREISPPKKKKKLNFRRGPQMSKARHTEL